MVHSLTLCDTHSRAVYVCFGLCVQVLLALGCENVSCALSKF